VNATSGSGKESPWRIAQKSALLGWLKASEAAYWAFGRRGPYGIVKLDLGGDLTESETEQQILSLLRRPVDDYLNLIGMLRWLRDDPRVRAVLISVDDLSAGWGRIQGLRRSLEKIKRAGKKVWIHLNGGSLREYYLASVADRLSVSPSATLDVTGLSSEATFFLGALEKVGIEADVVQMGRYKAAGEMFSRDSMSPEHREMMEALLDDLYGQLVEDIAAARGLEPGAVRETFDRGPFLASEARDARLVDALEYADTVEAAIQEACDGAEVIGREDYFKRRSREVRAEVLRQPTRTLGLLHINGTIKSGESVPGPEGANAIGARSIGEDLAALRDNDAVRAVIVRVSSPGGSGIASDLIWREIQRTREKKPVLFSFGDVAASGGYYVAMAGSQVFAEPGTITGSIGVIAGKANLRGLYDRIGVTKELVSRGRHASMFSDYVPLGVEERRRIEAEARHFYDGFVDKVAEGRKLTRDAVAAVAEWRVWTGRQAWTRGLVDELGGIEETLDRAKRLVGLPEDAMVAVERYPRPRRLFKVSFDLNRGSQARLFDLLGLLPQLRFVLRERVWAIAPFQLRFF